jgi:hypothetical protein
MEDRMRLCLLFFVCQLTFAAGQVNQPAAGPHRLSGDKVAEQLVGAWNLVRVETIRPNGDLIYPFYGRHPEGLLIYDRAGWMSVQMVSDPQPTVPQTDTRQGFLAASTAEKVAAVDGFYAYYGTWKVDPLGATVNHHIRQSLYPGERGEEGVRSLSIEDNMLTLTAKAHEMGEDHLRRLVWERITSVPRE